MHFNGRNPTGKSGEYFSRNVWWRVLDGPELDTIAVYHDGVRVH